MKFVIDTKADYLKDGFQHEMEAENIQAALDSCVKNLVAAHALYGTRPCQTAIVIWHEGSIVGKWSLTLQLPGPLPILRNESCPTCSGVGGVDSGGVTPWGACINVPCPSCADSKAAIIGDLNKTNGHRPECICVSCESLKSVTAQQDKTAWDAVQKAISDNQLKCGLCKDTGKVENDEAVWDRSQNVWIDCPKCRPSELAQRQALDETIVRLLERTKCGCLTADCVVHGSYIGDDLDTFYRITQTRKLLPPKQLVERNGVMTPANGTGVFTVYEANNGQD